ncbi:MAG: sporulation membrane protein YtaF [Thermodesulfobacteriota bacterium]
MLIALVNNLDNIGARIAYSIRGIKINISINLWIAVITFIISAFAAFSGTLITGVLSRKWSSVISMLLLTAIGLWIIAEPYMKRSSSFLKEFQQESGASIWHIMMKPEKADKDDSKHIDFKEATVLGIALSINNIGGGLGAGMIGLNSLWVGFFSAVISFLALWGGNYITDYFTRWNIGNKATVIAGLVLIVIGIEQII